MDKRYDISGSGRNNVNKLNTQKGRIQIFKSLDILDMALSWL